MILIFFILSFVPAVWLFKVMISSPETGHRVVSAIILLTIFLAPTWDIPIQKYRFKRMCELDSGITVYRRVGLSEDYYFRQGEKISKVVRRDDGGLSGREVAAGGHELKIKLLESNYRVVRTTDRNAAEWGRVTKFEYKIYDELGILGSSVRLVGGAGWFANRFPLGASIPGSDCPLYEYDFDRPSHGSRLLYEVFYKLDD
jgi:hypothetical protein